MVKMCRMGTLYAFVSFGNLLLLETMSAQCCGFQKCLKYVKNTKNILKNLFSKLQLQREYLSKSKVQKSLDSEAKLLIVQIHIH